MKQKSLDDLRKSLLTVYEKDRSVGVSTLLSKASGHESPGLFILSLSMGFVVKIKGILVYFDGTLSEKVIKAMQVLAALCIYLIILSVTLFVS